MPRRGEFGKFYIDSHFHRNRHGELVDKDGKLRTYLKRSLWREDHCCDRLFEQIRYDDYLKYDGVFREYFILGRYPWVDCFLFCPFCANNFPESLGDEWEVELKKALEIPAEEIAGKMNLSIPLEFRTDRWWNDRGL